MQRIVVSVTNDLVTDQRVAKICNTLIASKYELLVIGRLLPDSLSLDTSYQTLRLKVPFNKGFLFYAFFNLRLFFKLLFERKDILLANDLDTLLANYLVSKLQGKPLVFDSHELFSEVPELTNRPMVKWFWKSLEAILIPRISYCYTVSESISNYYFKKFGSAFTVIRNVPLQAQEVTANHSLEFPENKKILLYQGAVNKGRGLELLIETMKYLDEAVLLVVGYGDILAQLKQKTNQLGLTNKIRFYGKCRPEILKTISPQADLGLSLEEDLGLNYRYALPNKLFDYIHAQLPVIVSNLPEMKHLVEHYDIGFVLEKRTPERLAELIIKTLKLGKAVYEDSLIRAAKDLNWEKEQLHLIEIFNRIG